MEPPAASPAVRTIAEQEMISSLDWLIRLRWLAGSAVLLLTFMTTSVLALDLPAAPLYAIGAAIFVYNAGLHGALGAWMHRRHRSDVAYEWFARLEIGLDWFAMSALIHYSGGILSPIIIFFMFHIMIASLLLPHDKGFLYVTLGPLLVGVVAFLEYQGWMVHVPLFDANLYRSPLYLSGVLFFFTCAAYAMAYFSMTISRRLRRRENEVAGLYQSVRASTSTLDLQMVLTRLTEATASVLGCKAASIRLLDPSGSHLEMVTAFGLSEAYMDHAAIPLGSAAIDREALTGKVVHITDAAHDPRVRYPEKVKEEGIESILSAPLVLPQRLLGVLRAYGGGGHRFTPGDADFLGAVAAHGAIAIENAQAYRALEDLNRQKSQFVRIVTHELRSPIQVVQSLLAVLANNYLGELNDKQADLVKRTQRRAHYLQNLVDDLLNLAAGRADVLASPERWKVALIDVLKDLYDRFEAVAKTKGLRLFLECPDRSIEIWGRRDELDRLFGNLLDNALKYTRQGTVRLDVRQEDRFVRVDICDSGIGIPQKALGRIYEEFFRADNAKALEEPGTGLGLAIVKDLIARYEGRIEVQSVENQGTSFSVWLPALPDGRENISDRIDRTNKIVAPP